MIKISGQAMQGKRAYMEDMWSARIDNKTAIAAVFDGHGGAKTATALNEIFLDTVWNDLLKDSCSSTVLTARHLEFDDFLKRYEFRDGSTSTICLIKEQSLCCASLGDSEGYIFTHTGYIKLTRNHDFNNLRERERVYAANGVWKSSRHSLDNAMRVDGCLNISRAFGDFHLKDSDPNHSKVSVIPSIVNLNLTPDYKYIVLASDGLWDVLNPDDVLVILNSPVCNKSSKLVHEAYDRGSTDNISCVVMDISEHTKNI